MGAGVRGSYGAFFARECALGADEVSKGVVLMTLLLGNCMHFSFGFAYDKMGWIGSFMSGIFQLSCDLDWR